MNAENHTTPKDPDADVERRKCRDLWWYGSAQAATDERKAELVAEIDLIDPDFAAAVAKTPASTLEQCAGPLNRFVAADVHRYRAPALRQIPGGLAGEK